MLGIGDSAEVGHRGEEIGIEVEVSVGEVRILETTTPSNTEGVGMLWVPNPSTLTPRRRLILGTLPPTLDKGSHGVVLNKDPQGPMGASRDRTPPSPEVPSIPFPLGHSAKSVARTTIIPPNALSKERRGRPAKYA